ncbi:hypothetical protein ACWCPF_08920 [Streptomyces sp. NPDC001858]
MPAPRPFPELPFPDPGAAEEAGSLAVGSPAEEASTGAEGVVPPADGAAAAVVDADGPGPAEPVGPPADGDGDAEGLTVSSDDERVSALPPRSPRRSSVAGPDKDRPATTAASDTAPTAPAATTTRRERHPPVRRTARRRSARPPAPSSTAGTGGSRCVSSYAFSHPCAAAGSAYCS